MRWPYSSLLLPDCSERCFGLKMLTRLSERLMLLSLSSSFALSPVSCPCWACCSLSSSSLVGWKISECSAEYPILFSGSCASMLPSLWLLGRCRSFMLPVLLATNTFWDNTHWMLSAHTSNFPEKSYRIPSCMHVQKISLHWHPKIFCLLHQLPGPLDQFTHKKCSWQSQFFH